MNLGDQGLREDRVGGLPEGRGRGDDGQKKNGGSHAVLDAARGPVLARVVVDNLPTLCSAAQDQGEASGRVASSGLRALERESAVGERVLTAKGADFDLAEGEGAARLGRGIAPLVTGEDRLDAAP